MLLVFTIASSCWLNAQLAAHRSPGPPATKAVPRPTGVCPMWKTLHLSFFDQLRTLLLSDISNNYSSRQLIIPRAKPRLTGHMQSKSRVPCHSMNLRPYCCSLIISFCCQIFTTLPLFPEMSGMSPKVVSLIGHLSAASKCSQGRWMVDLEMGSVRNASG